MIRILSLCWFFLFISLVGYTQIPVDTLAADIEKQDSTYEYWKPKYYQDITIGESFNKTQNGSFEAMIERYQSKDFDYVESISDKLNFLGVLKERISNFFRDLFPDINYSPGDGFYTVLGVIGGGLVIFLIYKLFFVGKVYIKHEHEEDNVQDLDYIERNLMQLDMDQYLQDALNQLDYASAIRYLHLINVQGLAKKEIIQWDRTKTNAELMDEVQNQELKSDFLQCGRIFNYVWFGNFKIDADSYKGYEREFQQFQRRWL